MRQTSSFPCWSAQAIRIFLLRVGGTMPWLESSGDGPLRQRVEAFEATSVFRHSEGVRSWTSRSEVKPTPFQGLDDHDDGPGVCKEDGFAV